MHVKVEVDLLDFIPQKRPCKGAGIRKHGRAEKDLYPDC